MGALRLTDTVLGGTFSQCHLPTSHSMELDVLFNISTPTKSEVLIHLHTKLPRNQIYSLISQPNQLCVFIWFDFFLPWDHTHTCRHIPHSLCVFRSISCPFGVSLSCLCACLTPRFQVVTELPPKLVGTVQNLVSWPARPRLTRHKLYWS